MAKGKSKKTLTGKLLKKPSGKLVRSLDPVKAVQQVAKESGTGLVREGRTGHFKEEFEEEIKWLG